MRLETMHILMPSWTRLQQISETLALPIEVLLSGGDSMAEVVEPSVSRGGKDGATSGG